MGISAAMQASFSANPSVPNNQTIQSKVQSTVQQMSNTARSEEVISARASSDRACASMSPALHETEETSVGFQQMSSPPLPGHAPPPLGDGLGDCLEAPDIGRLLMPSSKSQPSEVAVLS